VLLCCAVLLYGVGSGGDVTIFYHSVLWWCGMN